MKRILAATFLFLWAAGCKSPLPEPSPYPIGFRTSAMPEAPPEVHVAAAAVVPTSSVRLTWCPSVDPQVAFEVWSCTNLAPPQVWVLAATVTTNEYNASKDKPMEFFKVRATNSVIGKVSDWATNQPCE